MRRTPHSRSSRVHSKPQAGTHSQVVGTARQFARSSTDTYSVLSITYGTHSSVRSGCSVPLFPLGKDDHSVRGQGLLRRLCSPFSSFKHSGTGSSCPRILEHRLLGGFLRLPVWIPYSGQTKSHLVTMHSLALESFCPRPRERFSKKHMLLFDGATIELLSATAVNEKT